MANSPRPYATEKEYDDIETNITLLSDTNGYYRYQLDVKNSGDVHLFTYSNGNASFKVIFEEGHIINPYYPDLVDRLFESQTLAPGQSGSYIITETTPLDLEKVKRVAATGFEFKDEGVTYSNIAVEKADEGDKTYKITGKFSKFGDYYYAGVADVKYDGKDYSFAFSKDYKAFKTKEEIDLDKLTIEKITFYRSSYNTYKGGYFLYGILLAAQYAPYIMLGFLVAALIIPPAIIIPIKVSKAKKRRKILEENSDK